MEMNSVCQMFLNPNRMAKIAKKIDFLNEAMYIFITANYTSIYF